jgi:predicted dehydrogenase
MLVEFGKAGWIGKARQQPDKVRQTLEKVRTDGIAATVDAVRAKIDQPLALGYSNVGEVIEVGSEVVGLAPGDRVISNGQHAEIVAIGQNLTAKVPAGVTDAHAAFTVLGAIGLQGIRLANPTLGECVAVVGLGLIGQLTVQMLRAQGCRVLGIDLDGERLALARQFGAETIDASDRDIVLAKADAFSRGQGVDAVLITAATASSEPVTQAARMSRTRGRIVLVGVTGLELSRADFYEKELSFQVSCSYGPGRYDPTYEIEGHDYPFGHVRWTEQRNFQAVLDLISAGNLHLDPLISRRMALEEAPAAYDGLGSALGVLLEYPNSDAAPAPRTVSTKTATTKSGKPSVAVIGSGNYAGRVLIPALSEAGAGLRTVVSAKGVSAAHNAEKHGFAQVSTDATEAFADPHVDTVVISTRHNSHAHLVQQALAAGKHVFVEKPLCLTQDQLAEIEVARAAHPELCVMVGFNRRFAPSTVALKDQIREIAQPKAIIATVNAGVVPASDWQHDPAIGGGRIVGEACHFIDLLRHLAGHPVTDMRVSPLKGTKTPDSVQIQFAYADGSTGTLHYLANGNKGFPKERIEVFAGGRILQIDNFRTLRGWGSNGRRGWRQNKGNAECIAAFCTAVRKGEDAPIPFDEILEVSRLSIEAQASVRGLTG